MSDRLEVIRKDSQTNAYGGGDIEWLIACVEAADELAKAAEKFDGKRHWDEYEAALAKYAAVRGTQEGQDAT